MAIRVPPGGSSLGSFLSTTSALALGGPRSRIVNGWAPDVALDIDFTTGALDSRITFARGSMATYYNSSGVITSAASGAPRFDYDPVALAPRGLLLEEQRTNRLVNSGDVGWAGGGWALAGVTATQWVVTAPDGGPTGNLLTTSFTSAGYTYQYPPGLTTAPHTVSCFVKKGTAPFFLIRAFEDSAAAWLDLTTGLVGTVTNCTATVEDVGNGWLRFALTRTLTNTTLAFTFGPADADNVLTSTIGTTIYLWGAQVEAGSAASSYIPTTTTSVTRAADTAEMTGTNFASWYNAAAGTFVVEYRPQSVSGTQPVISVNDTTANESIRLYGSGTDPKAIVVDGGATQADLDAGTIAANASFYKLGLAFTLNDFAACLDAGTVATDTVGTLPTVTQLQFHTDIAGNVANLHVRGLEFYPVRKSDSELQILTGATIPVGTGALAAQSAVIVSTTGVSGSTITDTTIDAGSASVSSTTGVSGSTSTGPGAIAAQAAAVSSTSGVSGSTITDTTLNAASATLSSTTGVSGSLITDTTLNASAAVLSSTTGVSGSTITDTTLNASAAVLSSTTGLVRAIGNASALTAQAATVIGIGAGSAAIGAGALGARPATIASTGLTLTIGSGALVDGSATLSALAVSGSAGVGNLNVTAADIDSLGYVEQGGVSIMVGGVWQRTTPYVRVGGAWKPATAWANVNGVWKRAA